MCMLFVDKPLGTKAAVIALQVTRFQKSDLSEFSYQYRQDLRKIVPARHAAEDSTSSKARRRNDAGAVLRKS